ncbi:MAG: lipid-transfer protein [Gammaproteobacteria bacterium]|uniref:propanoyl-CoA C-acyltransferase n=1 Tax=SAR86 cluster bacterium TaxID=2030880 RepID=A0A520MWZ6_9GAMM|nr:lipid-transfer protein [Gammaproteobacteria bacterium]MBA4730140.1 lipid-transfer protein [SAR86 cluster bacterium]RPG34749.1 MAG: lipid-transfer protein [Gammaproteobacteria bacterium TMED193]RZO25748.1 MAG: lipid-transfer protein [SAR86 cluster bacterium]|tara:strand:+ start:3467 stop:4648 length:1182 start_codon:yes stop_codon:yes gene_type:complete
MSEKIIVAGVGMIPFTKPGSSEPYNIMGEKAARLALDDANIEYKKVQQAYVGYVYGDSTAGQAALYGVGLSGIPIFNVNNYCSTGSSALFLARQAIMSGNIDCALALGFEQMTPGSLDIVFEDRPNPLMRFYDEMENLQGFDERVPWAAQFFGGAGNEHIKRYGTSIETLAEIKVKASRHAAKNPNAIFNKEVTVDEVLSSPLIYDPLTRLQCCPPSCGAAAALICSESFAKANNLNCDVFIAGQSMTTDYKTTFEDHDMRKVVGYDMAKQAAKNVFEETGVSPKDIKVCELHDCFTTNELISYEALGLAEEGEGEQFVLDGNNTYGGKCVTNPSGGLLSKGHPLGATGLAQCFELVNQLRGTSGERQVNGVNTALQHNLGLGGACVVTLYQT